MSRKASTFRRRDVTAAVEAVVKAGVEIARVEVAQDGRIVVIVGRAAEVASGKDENRNPWDEVLTDAADKERAP
jgi:hypothetical protein